jgi:putative hemolysin
MQFSWPAALVMLFCMALSFLCSGMEAGVFALSRLRVRQLMRQGNRRARLLHRYLEQPENFLWSILVGNTLANFVIVSVSVIALHHWLEEHHAAFIVVFVVAVFLFYAFFDLLPKMLFQAFPNRLCLVAAVPFYVVDWALAPVVKILEWLADLLLRLTGGRTFTGHLFGNRAELRTLMQDSTQTFTSEERQIITRVLDLQNITVKHVTIPWSKAVSVDSDTPMSAVLEIFRQRQFARLPVWHAQGGARRIVGFVSLRQQLYEGASPAGQTAGQNLQPALYLGENVLLDDALQRMQRSGQRLAIVLDDARRELGIVTLQDILRAIFGEMPL